MGRYRFTTDFQGTIGSQTERHPLGEVIELDDNIAATLVNYGIVEPADGDAETGDGTLDADELKAPAQRGRRVSKKSSA